MTEKLWQPSRDQIKNVNMTRYMEYLKEHHSLTFNSYSELYEWSIENRADFWAAIRDFSKMIHSKTNDTVFENRDDMLDSKWFREYNPLYIQYSSGNTGRTDCITPGRGRGGHLAPAQETTGPALESEMGEQDIRFCDLLLDNVEPANHIIDRGTISFIVNFITNYRDGEGVIS